MTRSTTGRSVDPAEIEKFAALADSWWDPQGAMRPLHRLNPTRLAFILEQAANHFQRSRHEESPLSGLRVLDIGCGGGLLAEPLARLGAEVTAIDAAAENVRAATAHADAMGLAINYRHATAEELAAAGESYDLVLAMEIVEHVADVESFLGAAASLVRPGGGLVLATLNRTPKAFLTAIVGAEYLLRWLPRGTHDWRRFLRPSELASGLRRQGMEVRALAGMVYNPLNDSWRLSDRDLAVNYLLFAGKPEQP